MYVKAQIKSFDWYFAQYKSINVIIIIIIIIIIIVNGLNPGVISKVGWVWSSRV